MKQELIKDWMTRSVITVTSETTLPAAHKLMDEHKVRRLPIVEDGRLLGIITRGDVRGAEPSQATSLSIWELNYLLANLPIAEIMTTNPITVSSEATISVAAQIMLANRVSGLPVLDASEKIVGIITESDIFRLVVTHWRENE